jgi:hypothetical protein
MKNSKTKQKLRRTDSTKRGLMTISPPAKVSPSTLAGVKVLASGVDSLNLALEVVWEDSIIFEILEAAKNIALKTREAVPFTIRIPNRDEELIFNMAPHGTKGYKWLFSNHEFAFRLYDAPKPKSRPNVMVEIRSETLWRRGIQESLEIITDALKQWGGDVLRMKASRIDLCLDFLLPASLWNEALFDNMVARARNVATYTKSRELEGVQIGKGKFSARFYDKALEIETKSQKFWMYKVWGIKEVPENKKAIRVEFQLLRESIKELGFDLVDETIGHLDAIWGYATKDWLKFQSKPGKHHTQRKTLLWWSIIQNSFLGVQSPTSAIRSKAVHTTQYQLASQIVGLITSLAATKDQYGGKALYSEVSYKTLEAVFKKALRITGKTELELRDKVNEKRAKHNRGKQKYESANWERLNRDLPADMTSLAYAHSHSYWITLNEDS